MKYVQVGYGSLYDLCVGDTKRETKRLAQPRPFLYSTSRYLLKHMHNGTGGAGITFSEWYNNLLKGYTKESKTKTKKKRKIKKKCSPKLKKNSCYI